MMIFVISEDGETITGKMISKRGNIATVEWSDGEITKEEIKEVKKTNIKDLKKGTL